MLCLRQVTKTETKTIKKQLKPLKKHFFVTLKKTKTLFQLIAKIKFLIFI